MGWLRILFYVVGRVMTALVAGFGLAWDYTGESVLTISSDSWGLIGLIAFGIFVVLTVIKEIDSALQPHPKVEYIRLSPGSIFTQYPWRDGTIKLGEGYFVRLLFQNNAKNPSGSNSTAQKLVAKVKVFKLEDNQIREDRSIDSWDGRWANTDKPKSHGDIWEKNAIDLEANGQEVILDIGFRFEGECDLIGWDNLQYFKVERIPIKPGRYSLQVALRASNLKGKDWWFTMNVPDEPQSNNLNQVQIMLTKKPTIRMGGSQT